jgi:hypothetical protein
MRTSPHHQVICLHLEGITAADYLAYMVDADPPIAGTVLHSVSIEAEPLSDTLVASLAWDVSPPAPAQAARLAGLPLSEHARLGPCETAAALPRAA